MENLRKLQFSAMNKSKMCPAQVRKNDFFGGVKLIDNWNKKCPGIQKILAIRDKVSCIPP
jgi:hypothetical protein